MRTKGGPRSLWAAWVELKEVQTGVQLESLFDRAGYSKCFQVYPDRYRVLYEYVDQAGLPHSLPPPVVATGSSAHRVPLGDAILA
jgi:hypothetical protein